MKLLPSKKQAAYFGASKGITESQRADAERIIAGFGKVPEGSTAQIIAQAEKLQKDLFAY